MTPYDILGLSYPSPIKAIKSAYRKLAFRWHPDRCKESQAQERFIEIQKAYEMILAGWEPQPVQPYVIFHHTFYTNYTATSAASSAASSYYY